MDKRLVLFAAPAILAALIVVKAQTSPPGDAKPPAPSAPSSTPPATQPDSAVPSTQAAERLAVFQKLLGPGTVKDDVLTIVLPRTDIELHMEMGDIPVAAGLESRIHIILCPCGKASAVGQICVIDYEANDVIDELRQKNVKIVAISPMFIGDKPRLLSVRFQGEGGVEILARCLRRAIHWTGDNRTKPDPDENK